MSQSNLMRPHVKLALTCLSYLDGVELCAIQSAEGDAFIMVQYPDGATCALKYAPEQDNWHGTDEDGEYTGDVVIAFSMRGKDAWMQIRDEDPLLHVEDIWAQDDDECLIYAAIDDGDEKSVH